MSPAASLIMQMCAESTPEQRAQALQITANAMPHIDQVYGELDFFVLAAFALGFITSGKLPHSTDWENLINFVNGDENVKN